MELKIGDKVDPSQYYSGDHGLWFGATVHSVNLYAEFPYECISSDGHFGLFYGYELELVKE